jgi:hypothetical protein
VNKYLRDEAMKELSFHSRVVFIATRFLNIVGGTSVHFAMEKDTVLSKHDLGVNIAGDTSVHFAMEYDTVLSKHDLGVNIVGYCLLTDACRRQSV